MLGDKHLHIINVDVLSDWQSKALASAKSGRIRIDATEEPVVEITATNNGLISVDLLQPSMF